MNFFHDPRYSVSALSGAAITSATAAGSGDATAINGAWHPAVDYTSIFAGALYTAALTAAKTLTLSCIIQTASDSSGTGAVTLATLTAEVITTTGASSGVVLFNESVPLDVRANLGFIRQVLTPDLSHTATDTASVAGFILTGPNRLGQPNP